MEIFFFFLTWNVIALNGSNAQLEVSVPVFITKPWKVEVVGVRVGGSDSQ